MKEVPVVKHLPDGSRKVIGRAKVDSKGNIFEAIINDPEAAKEIVGETDLSGFSIAEPDLAAVGESVIGEKLPDVRRNVFESRPTNDLDDLKPGPRQVR